MVFEPGLPVLHAPVPSFLMVCDPSRARHFLIACVAIVAVVGVIGWQVFGGRGDVLEPDGGAIVTVMDCGQTRSPGGDSR